MVDFERLVAIVEQMKVSQEEVKARMTVSQVKTEVSQEEMKARQIRWRPR
jgi:hypothetical protein